MNLVELATIIGTTVRLSVSKQWVCKMDAVEIKEGCVLTSSWGCGDTARKAIEDYVSQIRGKRIVFHASSETLRREVTVPDTLEVGDLH
jgi:hypothetical protein